MTRELFELLQKSGYVFRAYSETLRVIKKYYASVAGQLYNWLGRGVPVLLLDSPEKWCWNIGSGAKSGIGRVNVDRNEALRKKIAK